MVSKNTTNYKFLKDFKPELYKLAIKMEEDLLITPVSILAYSTRFLEYILHDIAGKCGYDADKKLGYVEKINELIRFGYVDGDFAQLLIDAYITRNNSIHNHNISNSLKEDKKIAFELNETLFHIADVYYTLNTNNYENHTYIEPKKQEKSKKGFNSTIVKQDKNFDNCIICGESTVRTKSNFCINCDNLLNYREVLAKIITDKGTNTFLKRDDFDYGFKDQLIKDLINQNVLQKVGNNYNILNDELDKYFILTDEFMEIDMFLADFIEGNIENPLDSRFYLSSEYPYANVSNVINEYYVGKSVKSMENGFSHEYALEHMGVPESIFDNWYKVKKSEFIEGNKDELFIKYNELLIKELFRLIERNNLLKVDDEKIDFWSKYFTGFSEKLSKKLVKQKFRAFVELFKQNYSKKDALNQVELTEKEFDEAILIHKVLADEYFEEIEKREKLLLSDVKKYSLKESLKKSNMELVDCKSKQELTYILQQRYLGYRRESLNTNEICEILTIDIQEVDSWFEDDSFSNNYDTVRLELFKRATETYKTKSEILNDLEISEDELEDYIARGKSGDKRFIQYYDYFENVYYDNKFKTFLVEFRINKNVNVALKKADLSQKEFDVYLKSNDKYRDEFFNLRVYYIADHIAKKGKISPKFLKKMGMSKKDYQNIKDTIDQKVLEKQVELITEATINDKIIYLAAKEINCNWKDVFDWIYMGSCGDKRFEELANEYWLQAIQYIKEGNSLLKKEDSISLLKHTIDPKALGEYDLQYWQKWGLIDKNNRINEIEDIKDIIKKNNS